MNKIIMGKQYGKLIYGIGHVDYSLPITKDGKKTKEYETWRGILKRCTDKKYLEKEPTYNDCSICNEWLYYKNFYEWIISQENYQKWKKGGKKWAIDKDILIKGNKIYSPETCCLVPKNVNTLFTNRKLHRGNLPIGVDYNEKLGKYRASCMNPFTKKQQHIGLYCDPDDAFYAYKKYKENIIQSVAELEYKKKNITKQCYEAMMNYHVEITD